MNFDKFRAIRKMYAEILPEWMADYEETGDMRHDPYFFDWEFTPIEANVWSDIRMLGLPFFPQIPVLKYFLDFGCPFLKIGIECDGKAWHNSELDAVRDEKLAAEGWMIFRIEGHECNRIIEPWEDQYCDEDSYGEHVTPYFQSTSEGILSAIKSRYFDDDPSQKYQSEVDMTLFNHMSTPETRPVRKPFRSGGPIRASDALKGYIERLMLRAQWSAA